MIRVCLFRRLWRLISLQNIVFLICRKIYCVFYNGFFAVPIDNQVFFWRHENVPFWYSRHLKSIMFEEFWNMFDKANHSSPGVCIYKLVYLFSLFFAVTPTAINWLNLKNSYEKKLVLGGIYMYFILMHCLSVFCPTLSKKTLYLVLSQVKK
jgi:hypothetical protein